MNKALIFSLTLTLLAAANARLSVGCWPPAWAILMTAVATFVTVWSLIKIVE